MEVRVLRDPDEPETMPIDRAVERGHCTEEQAEQLRALADDPRPDWWLREQGLLPAGLGRA